MMDIVLASAARTAIGSFGGNPSTILASELGAIVIRAALDRANLKPDEFSEVILGRVLTAGFGQSPLLQAAFAAEWDCDVRGA